jgi:hypothetical protein
MIRVESLVDEIESTRGRRRSKVRQAQVVWKVRASPPENPYIKVIFRVLTYFDLSDGCPIGPTPAKVKISQENPTSFWQNEFLGTACTVQVYRFLGMAMPVRGGVHATVCAK